MWMRFELCTAVELGERKFGQAVSEPTTVHHQALARSVRNSIFPVMPPSLLGVMTLHLQI